MQTTEYGVIQSAHGIWRVARVRDGAVAGRAEESPDGPAVWEWRDRAGAASFLDKLAEGQLEATLFLAWITPAREAALKAVAERGRRQPAAEWQQAFAERDMGPLAGVWMTDYYKGRVC